MNGLDKFLPTPPNVGPPLPSILKAYWPWLKQPPRREYVLPITEEPELVVESQKTEQVLTQAPASAPSSIAYEIESPPEVSSAGMPSRISPDWIRV